MEVELSNTTDAHVNTAIPVKSVPQQSVQPKTPRRAAEVFGFVTERRKSILERQRSQSDRLSAITRSSSETTATRPSIIPPQVPSKTSDNSDTSITLSAHIQTATVTKLTPISNPLRRSFDTPVLYSQFTGPSAMTESTRALHMGDSGDSQASSALPHSKIPRGPRPLPAAGQISRSASMLHPPGAVQTHGRLKIDVQETAVNKGEPSAHRSRIPKQAHAPTTPSRSRQQRRITSRSSSVASNGNDDDVQRGPASKKTRKSDRVQRNKENSPPGVPLRTIFDMRHPNLTNGEPPSPASSSELSPYTKDMMMTLRKQRMRARDEMRGSRSRRQS